MTRGAILALAGLAVATVVVVRLWPHGGAGQTGALSRVQLDPRDVRGMPVLWLGDNYDSNHDGKSYMQLTSAELNDSPELRDPRNGNVIRPDTTWYSMGYGSCVAPTPILGHEQHGCPVPLQIDVYSVCATPPLDTTGMPVVRIRGIDAFEYIAGGLWVPTANFTLKVEGWGKTLDEGRAHARQAVEDLIGANPEASGFTKDTAFAARDPAVQQECQ